MADILQNIIKHKQLEVAKRKTEQPLEAFINALKPSERDFYHALTKTPTSFILECKKASPSKGLIRENFDLNAICSVYSRHASCISVLTDERYFQGSFDYLQQVATQVSQPVLCKDFFIDPYQVYLARFYGADAILLMLSVLDDTTYLQLSDLAHSLNMAVLTEVSNTDEAKRATALKANIVGINNRNLRDLSTNLATTEQLRPLFSAQQVVISESGIYQHQDIKRLAPLCNGFLVGSALMAQENLELACRRLILGDNKVCGLTRPEDVSAAYKAGAVYGGLIFHPPSPRAVSIHQAKTLITYAPLCFVGVFVDARVKQVIDYAKELSLSAVQLHGNENQDYINQLREQLPANCEIWQAQGVTDHLPTGSKNINRILYDTQVGAQKGGTGKPFNWQLLQHAHSPFMLAGGLNANNIPHVLYVGAQGLDLNSGVEQQPAQKCSQKLRAAFAAIRNY